MSSQGPIPNIFLTPPSDDALTNALDHEVLMAHAFGCDRLHLRLALADYRRFVKRRVLGEPVAYITGHQEFFGYDFEVNSDVLIPRPETEKLVECALKHIPIDKPMRVVDLCTGSGCVAIAIALQRPLIPVLAVDISDKALEIARRNAVKHAVEDRIKFCLGNLLDPVSDKVDMIVANPPYIRAEDFPHLMRDVRDFEPCLALEGLGKHGLGHHFAILDQARRMLQMPIILLEIGFDQARYFEGLGTVFKDDAGHDRVLEVIDG